MERVISGSHIVCLRRRWLLAYTLTQLPWACAAGSRAVPFRPTSRQELKNAVDLWNQDQRQAFDRYGDISGWDTRLITDMSGMFFGAHSFNQDVSKWDTSHVTDMSGMFHDAFRFNQDVSKWNTSRVANMSGMFHYAYRFDQDVSKWDTSHVTDMSAMFENAYGFDQDVSKWDTSRVTDMSKMFAVASSFNQDVSKWDTSHVTDMSGMFFNANRFNQDVSKWDTSCVTNMAAMFGNAYRFNQDVAKWDTSRVTDMSQMFAGASSFNRDISGWDVRRVRDICWMFGGARNFAGDISMWRLSPLLDIHSCESRVFCCDAPGYSKIQSEMKMRMSSWFRGGWFDWWFGRRSWWQHVSCGGSCYSAATGPAAAPSKVDEAVLFADEVVRIAAAPLMLLAACLLCCWRARLLCCCEASPQDAAGETPGLTTGLLHREQARMSLAGMLLQSRGRTLRLPWTRQPEPSIQLEELGAGQVQVLDDAFLGHGSFGVYRGAHPRHGVVAIKFVGSEEESFNREVAMMRASRLPGGIPHPNILNLYAAAPADGMLVLEFCERGHLGAALGHRGLAECTGFLCPIASSLAWLAAKGIVHADVKMSNVLITKDGVAKLGGFGCAHEPHQWPGCFDCGTPLYRAPELQQATLATGCAHSESSDVWSFALVMHGILRGKEVSQEEADSAVEQQGGGLQTSTHLYAVPIKQTWRDCLTLCLQHNPCERPTFEAIPTMLLDRRTLG